MILTGVLLTATILGISGPGGVVCDIERRGDWWWLK